MQYSAAVTLTTLSFSFAPRMADLPSGPPTVLSRNPSKAAVEQYIAVPEHGQLACETRDVWMKCGAGAVFFLICSPFQPPAEFVPQAIAPGVGDVLFDEAKEAFEHFDLDKSGTI